MKNQLSLATPEQVPEFIPILKRIDWDEAANKLRPRVRVIPEIGCMALVDEHEQAQELLVFTEKHQHSWQLAIPETLEALPQKRLLFNQDEAAKGLGLSATNTPHALRRDEQTFGGSAAVRGLWLRQGLESIYVGSDKDSLPYQAARYGRHAILQAMALAGDTVADTLRLSNRRTGTKAAVAFMERHYGDAQAVVLPLPPSWRLAQHRYGIIHPVSPRKILARGGESSRPLHRYGSVLLSYGSPSY